MLTVNKLNKLTDNMHTANSQLNSRDACFLFATYRAVCQEGIEAGQWEKCKFGQSFLKKVEREKQRLPCIWLWPRLLITNA